MERLPVPVTDEISLTCIELPKQESLKSPSLDDFVVVDEHMCSNQLSEASTTISVDNSCTIMPGGTEELLQKNNIKGIQISTADLSMFEPQVGPHNIAAKDAATKLQEVESLKTNLSGIQGNITFLENEKSTIAENSSIPVQPEIKGLPPNEGPKEIQNLTASLSIGRDHMGQNNTVMKDVLETLKEVQMELQSLKIEFNAYQGNSILPKEKNLPIIKPAHKSNAGITSLPPATIFLENSSSAIQNGTEELDHKDDPKKIQNQAADLPMVGKQIEENNADSSSAIQNGTEELDQKDDPKKIQNQAADLPMVGKQIEENNAAIKNRASTVEELEMLKKPVIIHGNSKMFKKKKMVLRKPLSQSNGIRASSQLPGKTFLENTYSIMQAGTEELSQKQRLIEIQNSAASSPMYGNQMELSKENPVDDLQNLQSVKTESNTIQGKPILVALENKKLLVKKPLRKRNVLKLRGQQPMAIFLENSCGTTQSEVEDLPQIVDPSAVQNGMVDLSVLGMGVQQDTVESSSSTAQLDIEEVPQMVDPILIQNVTVDLPMFGMQMQQDMASMQNSAAILGSLESEQQRNDPTVQNQECNERNQICELPQNMIYLLMENEPQGNAAMYIPGFAVTQPIPNPNVYFEDVPLLAGQAPVMMYDYGNRYPATFWRQSVTLAHLINSSASRGFNTLRDDDVWNLLLQICHELMLHVRVEEIPANFPKMSISIWFNREITLRSDVIGRNHEIAICDAAAYILGDMMAKFLG